MTALRAVTDEDETGPVPPSDAAAERAVLGAMLLSPDAAGVAASALMADDFYQPQHAAIFAGCLSVLAAGAQLDPVVLMAELNRTGQLARVGGAAYLHTIVSRVATAVNVDRYVEIVKGHSRLRRILAHAVRVQQVITEAGSADVEFGLDAALDVIARENVAMEAIVDERTDEPVPDVCTWRDFTRNTDSTGRWIVPGLIRRHDAILILGGSGAGKSSLSRQVAQCLAAGVHPFRLSPIMPVRTLLVDLENAPDQAAEESAAQLTGLRLLRSGHDLDPGDRGWVWPHPDGLDLRKDADARLLERVIAQTRPDVLCMGSLYNAYRRGRDSWEVAAYEVQDVLKRLRSRYGLGLWLEHHMPRAEAGGHTGKPFGGIAWEQWPTHGRWLLRDAKAPGLYLLRESFRGDRGRRELPVALRRGGKLWWTAVWDEEELQMIRDGAI